MDDFFDKCKLCPKYGECVFADTPMSCAHDVIARDGLDKVEKEKKETENGS